MSGIDALAPDAFGNSLLMRVSMREVTSNSATKELPPRKTNIDKAAMNTLNFLVICEMVVRGSVNLLREEQL